MSRPSIVAVLVANGLGHARRTVGILGRFLARGGTADIVIVGDPWQRDAARRWPAGRLLEAQGTLWRHGIVAPGVHWDTDPRVFDDGRLLAWENRLDDVPELAGADVVVSDNLAGVLTRRPDTLLLGSFLWSDVLGGPAIATTPAIDAFVDHERRLLAAHRPEMLCVEAIATPGVLERTRPVPVGWMCQQQAGSAGMAGDDADEVAVLGGWTGAADDLLAETARALVRSGHTVTAAGPIAAQAGVDQFDPTSDRWRTTAAVVCRPGAGTLTDCVRWGVPVVCVDEGTNSELRHNGERVEALGLGIDAGPDADPATVVDAVAEVCSTDRRAAIRARMGAANRHGLDEAADWLALHCDTRLPPSEETSGVNRGS